MEYQNYSTMKNLLVQYMQLLILKLIPNYFSLKLLLCCILERPMQISLFDTFFLVCVFALFVPLHIKLLAGLHLQHYVLFTVF